MASVVIGILMIWGMVLIIETVSIIVLMKKIQTLKDEVNSLKE